MDAVRGLVTTTAVLLTAPFSQTAWAHGFGQRFTLPLPFWLYGGGACAALLLSFVVLLMVRPAKLRNGRGLPTGPQHEKAGNSAQSGATATAATSTEGLALSLPAIQPSRFSMFVRLWMLMNTALMGLAIVSGFAGSQHPTSNFSMTWFWIILLLGFFYMAAVAGRWHVLLNPWWCASQLPVFTSGRSAASSLSSLAAWPAFAGYMLLILIELFGHASPLRLGQFLLGYTVVWLVVTVFAGRDAWLQQFDTLHALFAHISRLSPQKTTGNDGGRHRHPLLEPIGLSAQMLIVAMLAATAFDALRESVPWATQLWKLLLTLYPQNTTNPLAILAALSETYRHAEMLAWLVMPFVYALLMAIMVWMSRQLAPVPHGFMHDMGLAALALLPLVLGYHVAHYFPLLFSEGPNLVHLLSDPLGEGWNLLGTAHVWRAPILLETDTVWHAQVLLIVAGHLGGVLVSHWQACQLHATQRAVVLSQLPMLVWMMGLTTWGLWILSQPMKAG